MDRRWDRTILSVIIAEFRSLLRNTPMLWVVLAAFALTIGILLPVVVSTVDSPLLIKVDQLFGILLLVLMGLTLLLAPPLLADAISSERERKTLTPLLTMLTPATFMWSRYVSRLLILFSLLTLCAVPSIIFFFRNGGVSSIQFFWSLLLIGSLAVALTAISLLCSAYLRTTLAAMTSYFGCFCWLVLIPGIYYWYRQQHRLVVDTYIAIALLNFIVFPLAFTLISANIYCMFTQRSMNITWRIGLFAMFTLVNTLPFFQYSGTEFPLLEYCVIASPISAFNSIVNPQSLQSINDREEFHAWIPQCLGLSGWDIIFVFSAIAFLALASWISLVSTAKVLWREVK